TVQVVNSVSYSNNDSAMNLIAQQLQLLGRQLELLQGNQPNPVTVQPTITNEVKPIMSTPPQTLSEDEIKEHKKPFGASPKIEKQVTELDTKQKAFLDELIVSYNKKTAGSKSYTQKHRS